MHAMTIGNALAFVLLGSGMILLPMHAPELFAANELSTFTQSALWLNFMGWVIGILGGYYLIKQAVVPQVIRILAWRPASPQELLDGQILRPAMEIYAESRKGLREEQAA